MAAASSSSAGKAKKKAKTAALARTSSGVQVKDLVDLTLSGLHEFALAYVHEHDLTETQFSLLLYKPILLVHQWLTQNVSEADREEFETAHIKLPNKIFKIENNTADALLSFLKKATDPQLRTFFVLYQTKAMAVLSNSAVKKGTDPTGKKSVRVDRWISGVRLTMKQLHLQKVRTYLCTHHSAIIQAVHDLAAEHEAIRALGPVISEVAADDDGLTNHATKRSRSPSVTPSGSEKKRTIIAGDSKTGGTNNGAHSAPVVDYEGWLQDYFTTRFGRQYVSDNDLFPLTRCANAAKISGLEVMQRIRAVFDSCMVSTTTGCWRGRNKDACRTVFPWRLGLRDYDELKQVSRMTSDGNTTVLMICHDPLKCELLPDHELCCRPSHLMLGNARSNSDDKQLRIDEQARFAALIPLNKNQVMAMSAHDRAIFEKKKAEYSANINTFFPAETKYSHSSSAAAIASPSSSSSSASRLASSSSVPLRSLPAAPVIATSAPSSRVLMTPLSSSSASASLSLSHRLSSGTSSSGSRNAIARAVSLPSPPLRDSSADSNEESGTEVKTDETRAEEEKAEDHFHDMPFIPKQTAAKVPSSSFAHRIPRRVRDDDEE